MPSIQKSPARPASASGAGAPIAVYVRIASILKTRILRGELTAGDRVPGIDELSAAYGVARATARQVLQLLVSEHLISSERGRGSHVTYVVPPRQDWTAGMFQMVGPTPAGHGIKVLSRARGRALPAEFEVRDGAAESYVLITKTHAQGGTPYGYFELYVDSTLYDLIPRNADKREKLFVLLHRHAGIGLVQGREVLVVQPADWKEAEHLHYQMGMPVVRVLRTMKDKNGRVIYAASNIYRGDRFRQDRDISGFLYSGDAAAPIKPLNPLNPLKPLKPLKPLEPIKTLKPARPAKAPRPTRQTS